MPFPCPGPPASPPLRSPPGLDLPPTALLPGGLRPAPRCTCDPEHSARHATHAAAQPQPSSRGASAGGGTCSQGLPSPELRGPRACRPGARWEDRCARRRTRSDPLRVSPPARCPPRLRAVLPACAKAPMADLEPRRAVQRAPGQWPPREPPPAPPGSPAPPRLAPLPAGGRACGRGPCRAPWHPGPRRPPRPPSLVKVPAGSSTTTSPASSVTWMGRPQGLCTTTSGSHAEVSSPTCCPWLSALPFRYCPLRRQTDQAAWPKTASRLRPSLATAASGSPGLSPPPGHSGGTQPEPHLSPLPSDYTLSLSDWPLFPPTPRF